MSIPIPANELERLAALASYDIVESSKEDVFDDLANLAARVAGTSFAAVTLLDADRTWFKASTVSGEASLPREDTFCAHTILTPESPLIVGDLAADPRFESNKLVCGGGCRAYLGVPLVNAEGYALGALCVIDDKARSFDTTTVETMKTLARAVVTNFELRRALNRATGAARTDALTGLPNRRTAIAAIDELSTAGTPFTAISIDLDFFKETNDSEGHDTGDAVLRAAAARLQLAVRHGDVVARLGGDEFVVLLVGIADPAVAYVIAQRICESLHVPVEFRGKRHRAGATLGLAIYPNDVAEGDKAFRLADEALIRAKRERRGSIGLAVQEDAAKLSAGIAIMHAFEASAQCSGAIDGATVHLQPIVTLTEDGSVPSLLAVEALTRWSHPSVGTVPTGDLFPMIGPDRAMRLAQIVRAQALTAFHALRRGGLEGTRLAINLSANEVVRADTALNLVEQVARAGLSLDDIEIEVTEEVLLDRVSDRALDELAALRKRGARLVLDDFGLGNSGVTQLLRLPLDGLKIDQKFVQRLGTDPRADEMIRATVSLARSLGYTVIAEGVETAEQATLLRRLGCGGGQGFLFAYPMSADDLKIWLSERAAEADRPTVRRPAAPPSRQAEAATSLA
jgi:diguanylate cyclase (GGDEF)-like protein